MEKPKPKSEVKITDTVPDWHLIRLYASKDALDDFREFGQVSDPLQGPTPGLYYIWVDARYDFDEVVRYIESYT